MANFHFHPKYPQLDSLSVDLEYTGLKTHLGSIMSESDSVKAPIYLLISGDKRYQESGGSRCNVSVIDSLGSQLEDLGCLLFIVPAAQRG